MIFFFLNTTCNFASLTAQPVCMSYRHFKSYTSKIVVVQLLGCVWLCDPMDRNEASQVPLSFSISWSLLKFMSIESVMLSKPSHLLPLPSPFAFNLSEHPGFFQCVFESGGPSIEAVVSALVLPMNTSKIELLISFL